MSIYQMVSQICYNNNNRKVWENISSKDLVDLPKTSKADLKRLFDLLEEKEYVAKGTLFQTMLIDEIFDRNDPKLIARIFSSTTYNLSSKIKDKQSNFYLIAQKIYKLNCKEAIRVIFNQHDKSDKDAFLLFIDKYYPQEKSKILANFEKAKLEKRKKNQRIKNRRQRNNDIKQLAKLIGKYPEELKSLLNGKKVEELLN